MSGARPAPGAMGGHPALGFVQAFTQRGWVAYAGGVLEVAHRDPASEEREVVETTVVRVAIGPEVRRWLATALLADPPAAPLAPLTERAAP